MNQETINTIKQLEKGNSMKKTMMLLALMAMAALMTGCSGQPSPQSGDSKQKTSTLSGNDVTALAVKFDSLLSLRVGDTITLTNSDGFVDVNKDKKGN